MKWKKCFFVLSKPAQSLPGIYHLNYYNDETCKRLRGSIDLEQCAEIVKSLDSDVFPYILGIRTTFKAKERTYFLATNTEEEKMNWVRNLCSVCGIKADDPGFAPTAPVRQPSHIHAAQLQPSSTGITVKPQHDPRKEYIDFSQTSSPVTKPGANLQPAVDSLLSYTELSDASPLEKCISVRTKPERTLSIDSVPDVFAPPPPVFDNVFNGVGADEEKIYAVSPIGRLDDEDLYKVPPTPTLDDPPRNYFDSGTYDVPPNRKRPSTTGSSGSGSQKHTDSSAHSSQNMYDYPPVRNDVAHRDDNYDVPPSHAVPPSRPPKLELYMNLPENRKQLDLNTVVISPMCSPPEGPNDEFDYLYSFPRSTSVIDTTDKLLTLTPPPPPAMCAPQKCEYVNAKEPEPVEYLVMNSFVVSTDKSRETSSTINEFEYMDMCGNVCDSPREINPLYDYPSPSCPVNSLHRPNRSSDKLDDSCASTKRTRSSKKKYFGATPMIQTKTHEKQIIANSSVSLPQRVERHLDLSASDDDEEVWETSPPVPMSKVFELKYIDLDHNDLMDKEPLRSPVTSCPGTLTEYHDIDFKKTNALRKVKETVSVERSKEKNTNA